MKQIQSRNDVEPVHASPVVTALIVTFNHRASVSAAIDSALAQVAGFAIEILVSEDASTDGTRDIVIRYAEAHPERIRLMLSERNIRSNEVVARGLRAARGRYVALLDGDDRWCDPDKLRRQAAFLDANPDCSAVFHNAVKSFGDRLTRERWTPAGSASRWTLATIMEGNPFATCAGMMRTDYVRGVPAWYAGFFPITDWPLYALCAAHGDLAFVDEVVGVYRLHAGGEFSSQSDAAKLDAVAGFYRRIARSAGPQVAEAARSGCSRFFFDWAKAHSAAGDVALARRCLRRSVTGGGLGRSVQPREVLRLGAKLARQSVWGG